MALEGPDERAVREPPDLDGPVSAAARNEVVPDLGDRPDPTCARDASDTQARTVVTNTTPPS